MLQANKFDEELVQGIFELILETVVSQSETILIASGKYPAALVKSKFLKLNYMHIDYVISCMKKNTTRVKTSRSIYWRLCLMHRRPWRGTTELK